MKFRNLGKSNLQVSEIGFGCMSLGTTDIASATQLIQTAVEAGINYFDTADMYDKGANEELLGKVLKPLRNKIILATKVGNQWLPDGSGWTWNPTKGYILQSVEESLRRLQTDRIDLYQLHGGTIDDPIDETIEAFEILKQQGKILHYGISSIRPNVIREYVKRSQIQTVMMQYSLLDRRPEEAMLDLLQQHQISVMARGVLAKGILVNKPAVIYLKHSADAVAHARALLTEVSGGVEHNTFGAIQFSLSHPAVTSAVIGFRTMEQLAAALKPGPQWDKTTYARLCNAVVARCYEEHR